MTHLEKRQELKKIISEIVWWWHHLPSQRQRDHYQAMQIRMIELIDHTGCPFSHQQIEAYKYGQVSQDGKNVLTPSITVNTAQMMDEWFDGYDVGGNND